MAAFDNTELLEDIRDRGGLPSADLRFTSAKLLSAATRELVDVVAPLLVESQTDRMVYLSDMVVTPGVAEYRIPSRALAGRWQSVGWRGTGDTSWTRLRQEHPDAYYLQSSTTQGTPAAFFVRDNTIVLLPTPNNAGTLRLPYYMRPNALVGVAEAGVVESVDVVTNSVTISGVALPAAFSEASRYDVVRASPGFESLGVALTASIVGQVMTLGPDGVSDIGVEEGDYVCLSGQSPVAQCPVELRALLATRAARRALKSVGEATQAAMLDADVAELTEVAKGLLAPRVDSEPQEWGDCRRGLLHGVLR